MSTPFQHLRVRNVPSEVLVSNDWRAYLEDDPAVSRAQYIQDCYPTRAELLVGINPEEGTYTLTEDTALDDFVTLVGTDIIEDLRVHIRSGHIAPAADYSLQPHCICPEVPL